MNVAELIERAHKQAQISGFWQTENVGEKFALIATEIMEYEDAVTEAKRLEEVADIVIRVFDLCGYLGFDLPEDMLVNTRPMTTGSQGHDKEFAYRAYRFVASATQRNRRFDLAGTQGWLITLVGICVETMNRPHEHEPLLGAILAKMEKNAGRPDLHGRSY
ncbi:MAG: hypothetical protein WKF67_06910 [Rubrobacteraceae bacterium]